MIKKTIQYQDFNGDPVTEDFWFHLSTAELMEMQVSKKEGFKDYIEAIIKADNREQLIAQFKKLILSAVGRRSEDGKMFTKNQQIRDEFESTNAYSDLFMELVTDEKAAAEFVQGLVPADFAQQVEKLGGTPPAQLPTPEALNTEAEEPTDEQLLKMRPQDMTREQLQRAFTLKQGTNGTTVL